MDPERHARVVELFHRACDLGHEERDGFLEEACRGDTELRREVDSLLAHDREGQETADLHPARSESPATVDTPEIVGPYRILETLGEGGMGVVYLAEQREPIHRKVALKLIKRGMDTAAVLARFESERQALALMDHPNVAKVLDAGTTEQGRPYFVMEYVRGVPITEHCDRERLTTHERLKLFVQVCEGIQHAHQKAIIHRDVKPSNVLVAFRDGRAVPTIIDFGVAKATAHRLTERTVYTELGVLIGTPEYMSPEQAEMTSQDVDTRTDVYSLGVLLYELLVGALPFEPKELRAAGFDEIRRRIREIDPPRPSTRVSTMGEASTEAARNRRAEPAVLVRQLRGDLDWITMKALEKDRSRRYCSPSELAADVRRHLGDEPIAARPPSASYRAGKFVRRHRYGTAFASVLVLLLLGFVGRERIQAIRIAGERDRARSEAVASRRVTEVLVGLLEVTEPGTARSTQVAAREILDQAAERVRQELADQPVLQGRVLFTLGSIYRRRDLHDTALPLLEQARSQLRPLLGAEDPLTMDATASLGWLLMEVGRLDEAEPLIIEVLEIRRRLLGDADPGTIDQWNDMGLLRQAQGRWAEAERILEQIVEARSRIEGDKDPLANAYRGNLASLYFERGRRAEAMQLMELAFDHLQRELGSDHYWTLDAMGALGNQLRILGDVERAEPLLTMALEGNRSVFGDQHSATVAPMQWLAALYSDTGRPGKARSLVLGVLAHWRDRAGRPDASVREKNEYAWLLLTLDPVDLRNPDEAMKIALGVNETTGYADPRYLDTLALAYHRTGQTDRAIETQRAAVARATGEDSRRRAQLAERLTEYETALAAGPDP